MNLSEIIINKLNDNLYKKHKISNDNNKTYILEYSISKIPEEIKLLFNLDNSIYILLNQEIIEKNNKLYLNYNVKYHNYINNILYNNNHDFKRFADNFILNYSIIIDKNNNIDFKYFYDKSYIDKEDNIINKLLISIFYNYMDNILIDKIKKKYMKNLHFLLS